MFFDNGEKSGETQKSVLLVFFIARFGNVNTNGVIIFP